MKYIVVSLSKNDCLVFKDDGKTQTAINRADSMAEACAAALLDAGHVFEVEQYPSDFLTRLLMKVPLGGELGRPAQASTNDDPPPQPPPCPA